MTIRFEPVGPLRALRLFKIGAELALEQSVGALDLLLFAQLHAVADHLRRGATGRAGQERSCASRWRTFP